MNKISFNGKIVEVSDFLRLLNTIQQKYNEEKVAPDAIVVDSVTIKLNGAVPKKKDFLTPDKCFKAVHKGYGIKIWQQDGMHCCNIIGPNYSKYLEYREDEYTELKVYSFLKSYIDDID